MHTDISSKAMLVDFSCRQWSARKHDKRVTQEVHAQHGAHDAGRWNKVLVARDAVKTYQSEANAARQVHYKYTLPWAQEGARILLARASLDYHADMRVAEDKWRQAVEEFLANYPQLREDARLRLNGMFNDDDYPTISQLRNRFSWEVKILPIPTAGDFRVQLADEEVHRVRASIEANTQAALSQAMRDVWQRLYDAVSHMAERLSDPDAIFRDTLVGNITELCGLLPKLNLTDDPNLEAARQEVEARLAGVDPENLRRNQSHRRDIATQAKEIQNAMAAYMQPGASEAA